jgi:hypothetical protein
MWNKSCAFPFPFPFPLELNRPPDDLKSGIPTDIDIPAPQITTIRFAAWSWQIIFRKPFAALVSLLISPRLTVNIVYYICIKNGIVQ